MVTHGRAEALPHAPFADTRRAYPDRSPLPLRAPAQQARTFIVLARTI
jgi:hypothetical protein